MGNGGQWVDSAKKLGYQVTSTPTPDTVVVYSSAKYPPYGHVAVVDSVNSDGTFNVSEMNFTGWDVTDQRKSTTDGVIGFVVPPGSKAVVGAAGASSAASASDCQTFKLPGFFPGQSAICMDPIIGVFAMATGGLLVIVGGVLLVAAALKMTPVGRSAEKAAGLVGGPVGAVVAADGARRTAKAKAAKSAQREGERSAQVERRAQIERARVRTARARARVSEQRARSGAGTPKGGRPRVITDPNEAREYLARTGQGA
jgi:hypothetical protein